MTDHNLFYYPYASFTNTQLQLLKVAAPYFDKLYVLDPVGASCSSSARRTLPAMPFGCFTGARARKVRTRTN